MNLLLRQSLGRLRRRLEYPARKLPRGSLYAEWRRYERQPDGREVRKRRSKIITRALADKYRIAQEYSGPLNRTDAQKVLDILIAEDCGSYVAPDRTATFAQVAREYLAVVESAWGADTLRSSKNLIEVHLISGKLGERPVVDLTEIELQQFLNRYVASGASKSHLSKLLLYLRSVLDYAVSKDIIIRNPARNPAHKLKARSRKRECRRYLTLDECQRLLGELHGPQHLIVRMLIQLGLRPEEQFALRVDDIVNPDSLRIDETIVAGQVVQMTKTAESESSVYVPPDLMTELQRWAAPRANDDKALLLPNAHGGPWAHHNFLNRVLKPAAVRANVGVTMKPSKKTGKEGESTDVNFQALRRTCGTHFGRRAGARDVQAQLRHADPTITLRHYQQSVPASVKAAALAFEGDLLTQHSGHESTMSANQNG